MFALCIITTQSMNARDLDGYTTGDRIHVVFGPSSALSGMIYNIEEGRRTPTEIQALAGDYRGTPACVVMNHGTV